MVREVGKVLAGSVLQGIEGFREPKHRDANSTQQSKDMDLIGLLSQALAGATQLGHGDLSLLLHPFYPYGGD